MLDRRLEFQFNKMLREWTVMTDGKILYKVIP